MKLGYTIIDVTDVAASTLNECQLFQILNVVFGHGAAVAKMEKPSFSVSAWQWPVRTQKLISSSIGRSRRDVHQRSASPS